MKKRTKISIILLLCLLTLVGCSSPTTSDNTNTLVVGMECNYAPFNWTQADQTDYAVAIDGLENQYCDGYDVQIAKTIAEQLNRKLVIKALDWTALESASTLNNGTIDLIIAGMTPTDERKQIIDFTDAYYRSEYVIVVRKDSPLASASSLEDFAGYTVISQRSTLNDTLIDQIPGVDHGVATDTFALAFTSVANNATDGMVAELPVAQSAVASNPTLTYVSFTSGQGFSISDDDVATAIGVMKDRQDGLLEDVNAILATISTEQRDEMMLQAVLRQPSSDGTSVDGEVTSKIPDGFFDAVIFLVIEYYPWLIQGVLVTIKISMVGTISGLFVGLLIACLRMINVKKKQRFKQLCNRLLQVTLTAYVEFFRGTPMMVQASFIYYFVTNNIGFRWSAEIAGMVVVSLNTAAYLAEIIRGGIQAVDSGQEEAARAIGLTRIQSLRYVILPQGIKNSLPAITNEFIVNIKDSSVLSVISVTELFKQANFIIGSYYRQAEVFFIACVIYLMMTLTISQIFKFIEKRMNHEQTSPSSLPTSASLPTHYETTKKKRG